MEASLVSVLRTWSGLSRAERGLLVAAVWRIALVRVALWVLPSGWIVRYVTRLSAKGAVRHRPSGRIEGILWAVAAASRRIPDASCLTQAIVALLLLRRHGYSAQFCVGVAHDAGGFRAHAWLERDGRVLIGRMSQPFTRLPDLART